LSAAATNLHLIRAFQGPRHARLERIWDKVAVLVKPQVQVHIHDNIGIPRNHGEMLQEIWEEEKGRPESFTIFTEFDFLPNPAFLAHGYTVPWLELGVGTVRPIHAAEYATRNPYTRRIQRTGLAGAWFIRVVKRDVLGAALDFRAGGPFNDPGGRLPAKLVHLLGAEEGTYSPFGVRVPGVGEHLFWSRHYNDPPTALRAGFVMGEIQRAVDAACDKYEAELAA
jgi:hypothetical protein